MSYQVFARKYRPQTFDEVVGQDHIIRTLRNAIQQKRLAHAYLFVGPRGTGKTSTARIIAKALNCVNAPTTHPCGVCDACKEIAGGNSLDVLEIDGASNNGVEQVRELRDNVRFAPVRGQFKIYIIDEVHMLTSAAFNALLKTLEEPPEHVKFIFATTEPQKVLPTILSRCQRFDLRRIPAIAIAKHLLYIAGQEKITLEPDAAEAIAKGADGGLRDAESMLDQLVAFCDDSITAADVHSVFGFTPETVIGGISEDVLRRDAAAALGVLDSQVEEGRDLMRFLADLITHFRNLLVYRADPKALKQELGEEMLARIAYQASLVDDHRLLDLVDLFASTEGRMKWAPNKRLHFEVALIKAVQILGQSTLTDVVESLEAMRRGEPPVERSLVASVARAAVPKPAAAPAPAKPALQSTPKTEEHLPAKPIAETPPATEPPTAPAPTPAPPPQPASIEPRPPVPTPSEPTTHASVQRDELVPTPVREVVEEPPALFTTPEVPAPATGVSMPLLWKALQDGSRSKGLLSMWLGHAMPLSFTDSKLVVGVASDQKLAYETLRSQSNLSVLESLASAAAGYSVTIDIQPREELALDRDSVDDGGTQAPRDPMEEFKNDEKIKKAMELFQAELQSAD